MIAELSGLDAVLILGPGEAKCELKQRLDRHNLGTRAAPVETADGMTDSQLAAKVHEYFHGTTAPAPN